MFDVDRSGTIDFEEFWYVVCAPIHAILSYTIDANGSLLSVRHN